MEQAENSFEYIAFVQCPLCTDQLKIKKYAIRKDEGNLRWSRHNFERHLKTHELKNSGNMSKKPLQKKLSDMFQKLPQKASKLVDDTLGDTPSSSVSVKRKPTDNNQKQVVVIQNIEIPRPHSSNNASTRTDDSSQNPEAMVFESLTYGNFFYNFSALLSNKFSYSNFGRHYKRSTLKRLPYR